MSGYEYYEFQAIDRPLNAEASDFGPRLEALRQVHARTRAFMKRLRKAGL